MNSSIKTDFSESDFTDPKSFAAGSTNSLLGRLVRFSVIFIIVILFLSIALTSAPKNQDLNGIRDERTILGDKKAKNHYIMMTDIMCPYCDVFSRLAMENQEKFDKYLKDHDIVFMRTTWISAAFQGWELRLLPVPPTKTVSGTTTIRPFVVSGRITTARELVLQKMRQPSKISLPPIGRVSRATWSLIILLNLVFLNIKCSRLSSKIPRMLPP